MPEQDRTEVSQEATSKLTVYQEVTNQIIAELEEGRIPWVQPWGNTLHGASVGLPMNAQSQNTYSGINILLLWGKVLSQDYGTQSWVTYKQAQTLGGNVKKGEKATTIVYADSFTPKGERMAAREENREPQRVPFLKRYRVFNIDQVERRTVSHDPVPVLKLHGQLGPAEWLITERSTDEPDILFGLCDVGMGFPPKSIDHFFKRIVPFSISSDLVPVRCPRALLVCLKCGPVYEDFGHIQARWSVFRLPNIKGKTPFLFAREIHMLVERVQDFFKPVFRNIEIPF